MQLEGLHHITCITADAPRNVDFYVRVLGLRLGKKTVNQDDPTVYHLFYTDEHGSPGSDLTFFEYPGARRGVAGAGMVHRIRYRVASEASLEWWQARLDGEGARPERMPGSVRFADPEGLALELVVGPDDDAPLVARSTEVPPEHALQGFDGVDAYLADPAPTEALLRDTLGMVRRDGAGRTWESRGPRRHGTITLEQSGGRGIGGAGTVHHVAWAAETDEIGDWQRHVTRVGMQATPIVDRFYFRSVYFREPGGILFELATHEPGFTADEPEHQLGEHLALPPRFEPLRDQIEPHLTPLPDVTAWRP